MEALSAKDRIIFPLDVSSSREALELVKELADHVGVFKIGLELHHAMTAEVLATEDVDQAIVHLRVQRELYHLFGCGSWGSGFWDGKFDDIPNTVGAAASVVGQRLQMRMFNVHASCGIDAMMAAVKRKGCSLALAVTVLTSREENDGNLTFNAPTKAKVLQFAREAKLAGMDGIVCSPQELAVIRKRPELSGLLTVVPGIQAEWTAANDQKRVMTPAEAVKAGADFIVVGRSIRDFPEKFSGPAEAADAIAEQIENALA